MKQSNILKYIVLIVIISLIPILSIILIKEYKSYRYEIKIAEMSLNYSDKQRECKIIGTTNNYIYVSRTDENGNPIIDSKWKVTNAQGDEIGTFDTNNKGNGGLVGLEYGEYYIEEISVPKNYELENKKYKFIVSAVDTSFELTATDMAKKNAIILIVKYTNGKPAIGVKYDVYSQTNQYIKTITTNEKGLAGVKNMPNEVYYIRQSNNENSKKHYVAIDDLETVEKIELIYNQGDEF